jgi:hypothetical protein
VGLERHHLATAPRAVLRDDHLGARVVEAVAHGLGREAAEDDGVHRADARAGEHADGGLGHHAHVDAHAVAGHDAELGERVGEAADLAVQLAVGVARVSPGSPSKTMAALFGARPARCRSRQL